MGMSNEVEWDAYIENVGPWLIGLSMPADRLSRRAVVIPDLDGLKVSRVVARILRLRNAV